jgi:hypothetical protein
MSDGTYDDALAALATDVGQRLGEPVAVLRGVQCWAAIISRERNGFFCWHSIDEDYEGKPFTIQGYYSYEHEDDARADALRYLAWRGTKQGGCLLFEV